MWKNKSWLCWLSLCWASLCWVSCWVSVCCLLLCWMFSCWLLLYWYQYTECQYAECHYTECRRVDCRGANSNIWRTMNKLSPLSGGQSGSKSANATVVSDKKKEIKNDPAYLQIIKETIKQVDSNNSSFYWRLFYKTHKHYN